MKKIDETFPNLGFLPALIIVIVIGLALQFITGAWMTMIIAGAFGALFTRRHRISFLTGLLGIGLAWTFLFIYLSATAYAMEIADFFISQLGMEGMGGLVIVISVLIGAFLGGFGGLLGRSLFELIDEFLPTGDGPVQTIEPSTPETVEEPEYTEESDSSEESLISE
jgi:hypothetical protein